MTTISSKTLKKLDRPPAGPNWVRFIREDVQRTAKEIIAFAKGGPRFSYQPGYRVVKDRIELGIDRGTALHAVSRSGSPSGRTTNKELVEAFFDYDEKRQYSAANPIQFEREYFRVSRDVIVPVAPISVIIEKGKFLPIFLCGWTVNSLTITQRRLLMTIYEDAFLSLTDYQNSPAEVLFFPKEKVDTEMVRRPEVWQRGSYELLPKSRLDECVQIFILAREQARAQLAAEIDKAYRDSEPTPAPPSRLDAGLFDWDK